MLTRQADKTIGFYERRNRKTRIRASRGTATTKRSASNDWVSGDAPAPFRVRHTRGGAGAAQHGKLLDGLGVETDSSFMDLARPFRQALTVGRPIGFRPVESLPPPVSVGATSP